MPNPLQPELREALRKDFMKFYMEEEEYRGRELGPEQYLVFIERYIAEAEERGFEKGKTIGRIEAMRIASN